MSSRPNETQKLLPDFNNRKIPTTSSSSSSSLSSTTSSNSSNNKGSLAKVTTRDTGLTSNIDDNMVPSLTDTTPENTITNHPSTLSSQTYTSPSTNIYTSSITPSMPADPTNVNNIMIMMQNMMRDYEERNKVMMDEFIKVRQERDEIAELLKKGVKNELSINKEEQVLRKVESNELKGEMLTTPVKNESDEKLRPTSSIKMTSHKTNNSSKKVAGNFKDDKNDEEVMESESDDDAHEYKSYVEWLLKEKNYILLIKNLVCTNIDVHYYHIMVEYVNITDLVV
jgi:predicted transcriptional regulator with HTH domain